MRLWRRFKTWVKLQAVGPNNVTGWYISRVPYIVSTRTDDGRWHHTQFHKDFLNDGRMPHASVVLGRIRFTSAQQHANSYAETIRQKGIVSEVAENFEKTLHYPANSIKEIIVQPIPRED